MLEWRVGAGRSVLWPLRPLLLRRATTQARSSKRNNESKFETDAQATGLSLNKYRAILRRRRAIILQAFVLITVVGLIITLLTKPVYHASAKLLVDGPSYNLNTVNS